jgi:hypothetical protein
MTAAETADMRRRGPWERAFLALMPWYDARAERERDDHTEELRQRSIAARISAERIRLDYEEAAAASRQRRR